MTAGQFVSASDIATRPLKFHAGRQRQRRALRQLHFQVQDNGGTANGGVDLDPSAKTITVNVTSVNDAPSGGQRDGERALEEHAPTRFSAADFGFTDPNDPPNNALREREDRTTLPSRQLTLTARR